MADPSSSAQVSPLFEARLRELSQHAAAELAARREAGRVRWCRPAGWSGDLTDWEGLHVPFARDESNQTYLASVKKPPEPGTSGDIVASTTMIDYLAGMERAMRARAFLRGPRAMAHMLGRKRGHGSPQGVFLQNGLEYVRGLLTQAKVPQ